MSKMVSGKEKIVPCACTHEGCTCQVYIAPGSSGKKGKVNRTHLDKKRSSGKSGKGKKAPVPRELTLPVKARILKVTAQLEITIGDKVIQSEVEIPGDQLK